jgi:hypothetical protein
MNSSLMSSFFRVGNRKTLTPLSLSRDVRIDMFSLMKERTFVSLCLLLKHRTWGELIKKCFYIHICIYIHSLYLCLGFFGHKGIQKVINKLIFPPKVKEHLSKIMSVVKQLDVFISLNYFKSRS